MTQVWPDVGRVQLFAFAVLDSAFPGTTKGGAAIDRLANLQAGSQRQDILAEF